MKISGRCCYLKFSIGTLLKLHFIEAIRSAPHRDWPALIMPLCGAREGEEERASAADDPEVSRRCDSIFRGVGIPKR